MSAFTFVPTEAGHLHGSARSSAAARGWCALQVAPGTAYRGILFTATGGHGDLQPLLPLAKQAAQPGHDVRVKGAASLAAQATSRGLAFTGTGPDLRPIRAPSVVHDLATERRAGAGYFVASLGRSRG